MRALQGLYRRYLRVTAGINESASQYCELNFANVTTFCSESGISELNFAVGEPRFTSNEAWFVN
ncbi:hypothetical protein GCM10010918_13770 [Paenibacillus radicis (ex Gao et al. 2016)]|uniref:Uncharacterized protein n=1 Tax=Paenibacillus radicis (ex Gao et al. 2016) TaxID=1737354 RepID=A0A917LWH9_9BACL|nr:hypothetical protein GCM10010918_13770 [Paenibacillus radicis (ex Gao et al. 2016)]